MKLHKLQLLVAVLMVGSMLLTACQPAATATAAPAPTTPPAAPAQPTAAPAQPTTAAAAPTAAAAAATGKGFWGDVRIKQAIAAAIDREALVDRVFQGRNTPAYSMVPSSYPGATEPFQDKYGTRDLDKAKKLLTDAGFTADKPLSFDLFYPPEHYGTTTADVMQVLKQQLEETGLIKVNLQTQAWAQYIGESVPKGKGNFPVFMLGWFPDFADPENWLTPFGSCNQSPDQGANYCDPKLDDLLAKARAESDQTKRNDLYKQIGEYWADNIPTLPLFWEPEYITVRNGVEGVKIGAPFEFNYNILSFDKGYKSASGKDDTIIIGTTDQLDSLDPQDAYATHDWEILKNTGVPLLKYKPGTADLEPGTADMPKVSDDGKTYTFTLKDNLKYADGTAITSADYVTLFKRLSLKGDVATLLTNYIDDVSAPDAKTVVFKLKDSYGFFPALAATAPMILGNPKQFPDAKLNKFPATDDGFGPYKMVSYKAGQQLVLQANPNYFGDDKPIIKNVIVKYFDKPATMSQAVEKGEIDIAWRVLGAVEATRLQSVKDVTVTKIDAPSLRYLVFNMNYAPK